MTYSEWLFTKPIESVFYERRKIMTGLKWFFMSRYKKLLYQIEGAKRNKQTLSLDNGVVLDFTENDWISTYCTSRSFVSEIMEDNKRYLITRKFPTGNRKIEVIKGRTLPEFTTAFMELEVEPFNDRW